MSLELKTPPADLADARARAHWACQEHAHEAAVVLESRSKQGAHVVEARLASVANRYWPYYEFSQGTQEKIGTTLQRERPITALAWAGKVLLALLVAYPGSVAMGEMLGYSASYALGFKAYLTSWPIVTILLLAAELLIITGTVEFRLASDARNYLYRGYNPGHYDRGYLYRRAEEVGGRRKLGWTCWVLGAVLAIADLGFNVSYMWDLTGQGLLSGLAGGFFTALLVGLSVLLAHVYEYHHLQLKESKKAAEHVQAGRGYVPFAGKPEPAAHPEPVSEAMSEAVPVTVPVTVPEAVSEAVSGIVPEPEPEAVPDAMPEPEAVAESEPGAVSEPEAEALPETVPAPEPIAVAEAIAAPEPPRRLLPPRTQLRALLGGQSFLLDEENTVGRWKGNSIVLGDESVADAHARVTWTGRTWEIEDLGSRNGTHVKGSRLTPRQPTPISVGTSVRFGKVEMLLDVHIGLPR